MILKALKIIAIALFVFFLSLLIYYPLTEIFLVNRFYNDSLFIREKKNSQKMEVGQISSIYRNYRSSRFTLNPFHIWGTQFHREKTLYVCFENVSLPLPLEEYRNYDWFIDKGYSYSYKVYDNTPDQQKFEDNFVSIEVPITKAKLVSSPDCSNFNEIEALHEFKVYYP